MFRDPVPEKLAYRARDLGELAGVLMADVVDALNKADVNKSVTKRVYVRAVFAFIEGSLSAVCTVLLEGQDAGGWSLSADEVRACWDAVHEPTGVRPAGPRVSLIERIKSAFKAGERVLGISQVADFSAIEFRQLRDATRLRDRLMHPKRAADLDVSLLELGAVKEGLDWFRASAVRLFEGILAAVPTTRR